MAYMFGLIGYPIKHSLSPWIHKQFMKTTGMEGDYSIYEVTPEDSFEAFIGQLKSSRVDGFNITVPYKEKIISYLDDIDPVALKIGAVNTVVNRNGKWIGYNTDGKGYVRSLNSKFPNLLQKATKRALILGAGGAAKGIFAALEEVGFKRIDIANRTKEKAVMICGRHKHQSQVYSFKGVEQRLHDYDIVIQTTSVGMKPQVDQSVLSDDTNFSPVPIYSDIVYQPIRTNFLQRAEQSGAQIHYGHTMLLYQAQYAFELWTGRKPNIGQMDEELKQILKGR
ncbi:shikimate dehydrogenase [Virgibacillus dokdonensis]|uniref:Shikimate dehydrogenase (NADP(+)) n=1 Tax=Virgibacillus dokdonensis TaxID=302167 RepID=A0A3E0WWG4_9BACI|nr:shikimate dehydrogenase [Virgibacillus dokdonensis]RFA36346.1 shikimate dehydrogenase [Virgibacillus dokdonensis]